MMRRPRFVFITGSTGYMGSRLIPVLVRKGYEVQALVRAGNENKLPARCSALLGDALDASTYVGQIKPAGTFIHLVGVPRPNPSKVEQFRRIDLASTREAVSAAVEAQVRHFVYVSVAQPAPVMKEYVSIRGECERMIRESGLNAPFCAPGTLLGRVTVGHTCCCRFTGSWDFCLMQRMLPGV